MTTIRDHFGNIVLCCCYFFKRFFSWTLDRHFDNHGASDARGRFKKFPKIYMSHVKSKYLCYKCLHVLSSQKLSSDLIEKSWVFPRCNQNPVCHNPCSCMIIYSTVLFVARCTPRALQIYCWKFFRRVAKVASCQEMDIVHQCIISRWACLFVA